MTERACAMQEITALGFALDDALLYLDTHPCDADALCWYQEQQAAYNAAKERYAACFGPLQMNETAPCGTHAWLTAPWPWEGEE